MRAARFHGRRDIRVESDVPVPIPDGSRNEVLIEVEWCGICGSDLHEYTDGPTHIPRHPNPHPLTGGVLPVTLGHEVCGTVKAIPCPNQATSHLSVGQPVMIDPRIVCRSCTACSSSNSQGCPKLGFLGYSGGGGGGFSEYMAVEARMVYPLPGSVSLDDAPIIEPLAVAYHAVKKSGFDDSRLQGSAALVVGGGPVGVAVIIALRAKGVRPIILSEPTLRRRKENQGLVDAVINPVEVGVGDKCRELTDGRGVDLAFDCAGTPRALEGMFDALRFQGTFVNVALWGQSIPIPFPGFFFKEIHVTGSAVYNDEDFKEVIDLVGKGKFVGFEKMVTSRIILEDLPKMGFDELLNNRDEHIKILVTPKAKLIK